MCPTQHPSVPTSYVRYISAAFIFSIESKCYLLWPLDRHRCQCQISLFCQNRFVQRRRLGLKQYSFFCLNFLHAFKKIMSPLKGLSHVRGSLWGEQQSPRLTLQIYISTPRPPLGSVAYACKRECDRIWAGSWSGRQMTDCVTSSRLKSA